MENKLRIACLVFIFAVGLFSSTAFAGQVTFNVTAAITQIGVTSGGNTTLFSEYDFHGKKFSLNDAVTGRVTYGPGSSANDVNGINDSILIYSNALASLDLDVPSANFSTRDITYNSGLILVTNDSHNSDLLWFQQSGPSFTSTKVYFEDDTATALSDFSLPIPFDPTHFTYGFAEFSLVDVPSGDRLFISARIGKTEFAVAVPEPSDFGLLGIGFLALFWVRRRRC